MNTQDDNQARTIGTWLGSLSSSRNARKSPVEIEALEAKDKAILALLGKLSLHYWRPDFTPQQAKQLYADYLEDLGRFALSDINDAIKKYRQSGEKFFPQSGQLVQIIRTIPSWDVCSQKEHGEALTRAAAKELQDITRKIEAQKPHALPKPEAAE